MEALMLDTKLYSLLKVYECGSFGAAAKKLSVTQPAVSHHIKALEEELGVCLFDRQSGGIIVTREGEAVIKCAKKCWACTTACGRICRTAAVWFLTLRWG